MTDPTMTDPEAVRKQYATDVHLETRRSVWQPAADGRDPVTMAFDAVRAATPGRVLEVGSGPGVFAARLAALTGVDLMCTDLSPRFVEQVTERGIAAQVADAQHLPFAEDSFDVVYAGWMLYHVPDVGRALTEVRRVLRPGGTFVAATNGDEHVADLRREAGGTPMVTAFSSQNGEPQLRVHFDSVIREDVRPRAVFAHHGAAMAYLRSSGEDVAWELPWFDGSREYLGEGTIFACR